MKVMLVNGSSHLHGTTMAALEEMIKVFHSEEVETEVVQLGGKPIADCLQCNVCQKTGKCVIKDDGVNEFVEKAKTADGFVFATPLLGDFCNVLHFREQLIHVIHTYLNYTQSNANFNNFFGFSKNRINSLNSPLKK